MNVLFSLSPASVGRFVWTWAVISIDDAPAIVAPLWKRPTETGWHTPADFPGAVPAGVANLLTDGKALIALARAYESQTASIIP